MNTFIHLSGALALVLSVGLSESASLFADSGATTAASHQITAQHKCPRCRATCCELKVEKVDEEKHCWKVECETICVPRVVFPWQKDCRNPGVNNGAWVKNVRVLKKHEYTCPACEYSWTPVDRGCCGVGCGNAGCVACQGMPIEMGISVPRPTAAPLPPPASPEGTSTAEPTPAAGASLDQKKRGFVEHQKVTVASFVSGILRK